MRTFVFTVFFVSVFLFCFSGQKSFSDERLLDREKRQDDQTDRLRKRIEDAREFMDKNKTPKNSTRIQNHLDKYLSRKDDSYQWKLIRKIAEKTSLVELTSQKWHGVTWKHYLLVVVPDKVVYADHALIYIGGGANGKEPKRGDILHAQFLATRTTMPVAILFQVPNQPLDPAEKGEEFYEDALIGETLVKAIETGDMSWALLLPMTKSVIKAMDASQEFIKQEYKHEIKKFIVGGASKRGWTTWLAGASKDPRIAGLVPIVYNNLNLLKQLEGHIETWGKFSPRIHDYIDRGLFKINEIPSPQKLELIKLIDPHTYIAQINVPKLLIHGSNDPYWPTDATKYYWNDIRGQKYMLTLPNTEHHVDAGLNVFKLFDTAAAFARQVASGKKLPKFEWNLTEKESKYNVSITTEITNPKLTLWKAVSNSKNFQDSKWEATPLQKNITTIEKPASGHVAFFVELESKSGDLPFSLTTQVWRF
ncbi:MAG: PhoPQ-activated pathogenicity-related family protein [Planctomycetaceae bacterium]|jgi:PhoPQ-activated pathogenicity-related protein|nr:PhoPQ-activated pathogenicity-related family protein [Planctomycetaceae bacterium]